MSEIAIFVSDLHLGRGDELDDFVQENEAAFVDFLDWQSQQFLGSQVDLVLLGDFLDVWQVATDREKNAPSSAHIGLGITSTLEAARVDQIVSAHGNACGALGRFLAREPAKRRIVCVAGNHDHSLVHPDVNRVVSDAITKGAVALEDKVLFPYFYDASGLLTYAEHGNQYDVNNDYDNFHEFGPECPGFFFVRLFWNRLEQREPNADIWVESFVAILKNRLWNLIGPAYRLYRQYRSDPRPFERIDVPGVPFFTASGVARHVPVTGKTLPDFPELLFGDGGHPENIFSLDVATENRFRALYHDPDNKQFKDEIDKILEEKFPGTRVTVPEQPVLRKAHFGLLPDPYIGKVEGMFAPAGHSPETLPMKGTALNPGKYRYVLLGHTHHEKEEPLSGPGKGTTYINTGSWSVRRDSDGGNVSRLSYVVVKPDSDGKPTAVRDAWPMK